MNWSKCYLCLISSFHTITPIVHTSALLFENLKVQIFTIYEQNLDLYYYDDFHRMDGNSCKYT